MSDDYERLISLGDQRTDKQKRADEATLRTTITTQAERIAVLERQVRVLTGWLEVNGEQVKTLERQARALKVFSDALLVRLQKYDRLHELATLAVNAPPDTRTPEQYAADISAQWMRASESDDKTIAVPPSAAMGDWADQHGTSR